MDFLYRTEQRGLDPPTFQSLGHGPTPVPPLLMVSSVHPSVCVCVCLFAFFNCTSCKWHWASRCHVSPRLRRQSKVASLLSSQAANNSYNHCRRCYDRAPPRCSCIIAALVVTYLQYQTFTGCAGPNWASIKGTRGRSISVSRWMVGMLTLCPKGHHSPNTSGKQTG